MPKTPAKLDTNSDATHTPSVSLDPVKAEPKLPFESLVASEKVPEWLAAAVRVGHRLPVGFELTKSDFVGLLEKTKNFRFGY